MDPLSSRIPVIIDIEASGFGRGSYPIEVGLVDDCGKSWCSLIRPEQDWQHWDQDAERLHQIRRELLYSRGKPAAEVALHLNRQLHGLTVYCDGWAHDYVWLARLYDAVSLTPSFRLEDLRVLLSPDQQSRWQERKDVVRAQLAASRHRASIDAIVLQLTWLDTRSAAPATLERLAVSSGRD